MLKLDYLNNSSLLDAFSSYLCILFLLLLYIIYFIRNYLCFTYFSNYFYILIKIISFFTICNVQALREQIENYNKQIGIIQERIKMIQSTRMPDKDPYKATILPLPMSGVLPPPPKIYIPPETPQSPVSRHRTVTKETVIKEKYSKTPQSPIDPKFSYAAAVVSGHMSPMVGSRENSPFTRCLTPSRASPRTDLFESYIKKEHVMTSSQTSLKAVSTESLFPSSVPAEEIRGREKHKKQGMYTSSQSKHSSNEPPKTKLSDSSVTSQEKSSQKSSVADSTTPVEGTSWASGFLSKPSYADILSGRASPLPHSASPETPDNSVVTSAYQKEIVSTEGGDDTTEKLESSAYKVTSYTVPLTPEPVVEMPESPDDAKSKQKKSKKLPTVPNVGHFARAASPKFFNLKARTPSPPNLKEFSESRLSSTSVSKTVVFSEGAKHVTQTESSHSQIETKSFCASPKESRKLTYAQVARISSPVDGTRSASPLPSTSKSHSQVSQHKIDPQKLSDSSSAKSTHNQKSFLEINSDNRNRPKLDAPKSSEQSIQTEQNQKNLIRPLLSIGEGALNVHLLSRGGEYHHPLFCEVFQISQEYESEVLLHFCVFGISKTSYDASLHEAMSMFSGIRSDNNSVLLSSGQIKITTDNCSHIKEFSVQCESIETVLLCLDCGSLFMNNEVVQFSEYKFMLNYWDALACCFLNLINDKNVIVLSSLFSNSNTSSQSSVMHQSLKGYFTPVPTHGHLLQCMFHPSNKSKRKPKIKLLQNFSPDAVIVTDNSKYLCIPVAININNDRNVEEEVANSTEDLLIKGDFKRKHLEVFISFISL